jgi:hypothetical protein
MQQSSTMYQLQVLWLQVAHCSTSDALFLLSGCAKADDAAAAGFKPRAPTAWSVISSNPTLSEVAGVIQRLGLQAAYDRAFSGTLLLPTNEVRRRDSCCCC